MLDQVLQPHCVICVVKLCVFAGFLLFMFFELRLQPNDHVFLQLLLPGPVLVTGPEVVELLALGRDQFAVELGALLRRTQHVAHRRQLVSFHVFSFV